MNGKYKDFQSSLEFLLDYGFEFSKDSATGRKKCYKNEYGEIVLRSKQIDANYYIPQICIEIHEKATVRNETISFFHAIWCGR